jgi:hypothetical protein
MSWSWTLRGCILRLSSRRMLPLAYIMGIQSPRRYVSRVRRSRGMEGDRLPEPHGCA